jgi:hypothetical protein
VVLLTDLLTRRCGTGETRRNAGDGKPPRQAGQAGRTSTLEILRDGRDGCRLSHNPEVAGSNPAPATKAQVKGPLRFRGGPFRSVCYSNGAANEGGSASPAETDDTVPGNGHTGHLRTWYVTAGARWATGPASLGRLPRGT